MFDRTISKAAVFSAALVTLYVSPATAQSVEAFYRGATVMVLVPYGPGGGFDLYGRLIARHLGKHIPGNPSVIVQNMAGAGGLQAINYAYVRAPKDGTVLVIPTADIALTEALGTPGIQYKAADFNWIGRVNLSVEVSLNWSTSKVKTIEDAKKVEISTGSGGISSGSYVNQKLLNNVVGTKFKIISGYRSASEILLAMERGETEAAYTSWITLQTAKAHWLREKKINVLTVYTAERLRELPDVPSMVELGNTPEDRQVLSLYASSASIGRSLMTTPGVPADRLQALRAAFMSMIEDTDFRAEIDKMNAGFGPLPGEKLQKLVAETVDVSPALLERARKAHGN